MFIFHFKIEWSDKCEFFEPYKISGSNSANIVSYICIMAIIIWVDMIIPKAALSNLLAIQ
jgi:hypothetical protein